MALKFNPLTGKLDEYGPVLTGTGTVSAAADGTAALPGIAFASDLNTGIYRPGADQLAISTGGTGRVFITSDGKLGLGTSSPQQLLDVAASTGGIIRLTSTNTSAAANENIGKIEYYSMDADGAHVGAYIQAIQDPFDAFGRATALTFATNDISASVAERLRIDRLGRVGIGTASPNTKLEIREDSAGSIVSLLKLNNNAAIASGKGVKIEFGLSDTPSAGARGYIENVVDGSNGTYMAFGVNAVFAPPNVEIINP